MNECTELSSFVQLKRMDSVGGWGMDDGTVKQVSSYVQFCSARQNGGGGGKEGVLHVAGAVSRGDEA